MLQLSQNKPFKLGMFIVMIALLIAGSFMLFKKEPDLPPNALIDYALDKTIEQKDYRFTAQAKILVSGKEDLLMEVKGERDGLEKIHIKGQIQGSNIEVYQIGSTIYSRDIVSGKLIITQANKIGDRELFLSDLNPMANFNFKDIPEAKLIGEEKFEGEKCIVIDARPNVDNPFLELLWTDFKYKFWVDKKSKIIRKAILKAKSKSVVDDEYTFNLHIFDYGNDINIEAPKE